MDSHLHLDDVRVQAALKRVSSGESDSEAVHFGGPFPMELHVSRHPENPRASSLECIATEGDEVVRSVIFHPSASRPVGYPERFPFIPGCLTTWSELGGAEAHVAWTTEDDVTALYSLLVERLTLDRWTRHADSPGIEGAIRQVAFLRAGLLRVLVLQAEEPMGLVSLLEMPETAGAA